MGEASREVDRRSAGLRSAWHYSRGERKQPAIERACPVISLAASSHVVAPRPPWLG